MTADAAEQTAAKIAVWVCHLLAAELSGRKADARAARSELDRLGVSIRLRRSLTDEGARR